MKSMDEISRHARISVRIEGMDRALAIAAFAANPRWHIEEARRHFIAALGGEDERRGAEALIAKAIDAMGYDEFTAEDHAALILDAILDRLAPMPEVK